jgi:hypothetical protein
MRLLGCCPQWGIHFDDLVERMIVIVRENPDVVHVREYNRRSL